MGDRKRTVAFNDKVSIKFIDRIEYEDECDYVNTIDKPDEKPQGLFIYIEPYRFKYISPYSNTPARKLDKLANKKELAHRRYLRQMSNVKLLDWEIRHRIQMKRQSDRNIEVLKQRQSDRNINRFLCSAKSILKK